MSAASQQHQLTVTPLVVQTLIPCSTAVEPSAKTALKSNMHDPVPSSKLMSTDAPGGMTELPRMSSSQVLAPTLDP